MNPWLAQLDILNYLCPEGPYSVLIAVLQWSGFVILAYEISKRTSLFFQIVLTPILGALWILSFNIVFFKAVEQYHLERFFQ